MAFAAVNNDEVTSVKLKEADGTSGQNTNSGSGVKTGHIQDGAVTTAKIGADAVTTGNIADGAVTDVKITGPISGSKLGAHGHSGSDIVDGTITNSKLASGSVDTAKIVDGAVTDAKISGTISASKITDGVFQKKYANVIVVAKSGGDFTDPISAINSITDASSSNPYLLKIMPGIYTLSAGAFLQMKAYVDIEGSGESTTRIVGSVDAVSSQAGIPYPALVNGALNSELRLLTFENAGGGNNNIAVQGVGTIISSVTVLSSGNAQAIGIIAGDSTIIRNATVIVTSSSPVIGIMNAGAPDISNSTISLSGAGNKYGFFGFSGAGKINNVTVTTSSTGASTGVLNSGGSIELRNFTFRAGSDGYGVESCGYMQIHNSSFEGVTTTINNACDGRVNVVGTKMSVGGVRNIGASVTVCAGVYDSNYVFYPNTCP